MLPIATIAIVLVIYYCNKSKQWFQTSLKMKHQKLKREGMAMCEEAQLPQSFSKITFSFNS